MKMRCCVPFCKNASDNVSTSEAEGKGISFHAFPSEVHLRAAWLRALGKQDSNLPDSAAVCSQHFLSDDIYETESGRQIVTGAIPSTVQVCMICLDTDSKMFLMSKHKLEEAYEKLTGHPAFHPGNLKQTVCVQCAHRLINFSRFREKSLRACALMTDLVEKHELITRQHVTMINRRKHQLKSNMVLTTLGPDHWDLHIIEHSSEDQQTELEETGHRVVVKTEGSDDSMSVDEDMGVINEDDNNVDDFVQDPLKYESAPFQCTLCLEEFVHEHVYMRHVSMHLQDGDGECDTSQVCKPHTAVSSSCSHSSLITENKQPEPSPAAHAAHNLVAPPRASLATNNDIQVSPTEEADTNAGCRYRRLTDCFVKLYDVFQVVPRRDVIQNIASKDIGGYQATSHEVPATEYFVPATNTVKATVSKTSQSKTDSLNSVISIQCNNSTQNSSHNETISFICDVCRKVFKRKGLLVKHIKTHFEIKPFTCKICQYKCKHQSYLTMHMRTHTGEKPYACKICNSKFAQNSHLIKHMRTHTGEKPFICSICNSKFAHKSHLVTHMRTHTGEKPYACKICNSKFAQNSHLIKHMRTHTGEKPFICSICNSKFGRNSLLVLHMRIHTGEKPFICSICNSKFGRTSNLVRHMRTHTGEKPYNCNICNSKFAHKSYLVTHMRTHTGEKPYACKICNSKFAQNSHLIKHMRTHTGEKPFVCSICNSKFARKSHLERHMRIHTGEKPYDCKICNSKFARKSNLVEHMRTHTGEKPFICSICNSKFGSNSNLMRHLRTHTGETPYS